MCMASPELRRLLEGKVDSVIRGMRYLATHDRLKGQGEDKGTGVFLEDKGT